MNNNRPDKFNKLLQEHIEKFLDELPLKDHIKSWEIIWHSRLAPPKVGAGIYDLKLHTHYVDNGGESLNVVIGVKVK